MLPVSNKNKRAYLIPYPVESFSKPILITSQDTSIGRDTDDTIQIVSKKVSRKHALITNNKGQFFVEDMGSQNGTYVNEIRIKKELLKSHDKITVGDRTFLFLLQSTPLEELLLNPGFDASDTIAISEDDIDLSELWAQAANTATEGFFQQAELQANETLEFAPSASKRLSQLYKLSEKLRTTKDENTIYEQGLDLIMEAIHSADYALIMLKAKTNDTIRVKTFRTRKHGDIDEDAIPISRTLLDWVLTEKVALISQNVDDDLRFQDSDSIRIHNVRSIICVPLLREDGVIGVLYAGSRTLLNPVTQEDAIFAAAVANELALSIDNIRLQKEALRNERMAAIGLTVTNLAHNIRNLITLNQSATQLLEQYLLNTQDTRLKKNLEWIQQSFTGIHELTNGMLEYARDDELFLAETDINEMILRYKKIFEKSLKGEGIEFLFKLSPQKPKWMMDETQFQRAFFNLVTNAIHAVDKKEDGQISVETAVEENRRLIINVSDNGCGLDPKKKDRILELFVTTKGTKGNGLGLPMVLKFVEKMGGKLDFGPNPDRGAFFKMIFPKQK